MNILPDIFLDHVKQNGLRPHLFASPGSGETGAGLYRIDVTCGPGSGVKILNQPTPPAFRESVRVPDELWTKINIEFYKDSADAVFKALVE